jgi:hypothetical protein
MTVHRAAYMVLLFGHQYNLEPVANMWCTGPRAARLLETHSFDSPTSTLTAGLAAAGFQPPCNIKNKTWPTHRININVPLDESTAGLEESR